MWWPDRCCSGWPWSRPFRTACPTTTGSTTRNSYTPRLWIRMRVSSSFFVVKPDGPRISQIQPHLPGATENDDQPHRPHTPQLDPRVSFELFWRLGWFHAQKALYPLCAARIHVVLCFTLRHSCADINMHSKHNASVVQYRLERGKRLPQVRHSNCCQSLTNAKQRKYKCDALLKKLCRITVRTPSPLCISASKFGAFKFSQIC